MFEVVQELNAQSIAEFNTSTFNQYTDVIIDDAHAIPVQGEPQTWQIYDALFASLQERKAHAYIFLDPDMQDYRGCIPENFLTQLRALAAKYVTEYNVTVEPLDKILRNSRRICQFTMACMNTGNIDKLSTVRQIPEDGVFFRNIQGKEASQDETTVVSRLSNLKQYRRQDIAILTDNQEDKTWVKDMLNDIYPTQDATLHPRQCIVVDCIDNCQDLESPVMLYIVPQTKVYDFKLNRNWHSHVSASCTCRVEFLFPWDPSQREPDLTKLKEDLSLPVNMLLQCTWCIQYFVKRYYCNSVVYSRV